MAQVSDSSASFPESLGPLQTSRPDPIRDAADENTGSKRVTTQEQAREAQQAQREEDNVRISREAQDQGRENRIEGGQRNAENLRPQSEQNLNERGAAQRLTDLQNSNARGVRDTREAAIQVEEEAPASDESNRSNSSRSNQVQLSGPEIDEKIVEQEAADRKSAEVQLRQFQTKDEVRIEPKIVSESVDEIEQQREKAEAAKEPALEPPSQRIDPSGVEESPRTAEIREQVEQAGDRKEPPNPVSVQTETGQNVDDLI